MQMEKLLLRSCAKEKRKTFCDSLTKIDLETIHQTISTKVLSTLTSMSHQIIAGYWPKENEASPCLLMERLFSLKNKIVLPVIDKENDSLYFRQWDPMSPLKIGPYQLYEPFENQPCFDPDILLIPLLSFDNHGYRLGYGKGHYDKVIATLETKKPIITIGLAYDIQQVEQLPIEPHDKKLQWIVTEKNIYNFGEDK